MVKVPNMADEDLMDVIAFLRSDDPLVRPVKSSRPAVQAEPLHQGSLCRVAFKPLPCPAMPIVVPDPGDKVAHGEVFLVQGPHYVLLVPLRGLRQDRAISSRAVGGLPRGGNAMPDMNGRIVKTASITPDAETQGLGNGPRMSSCTSCGSGCARTKSVIMYADGARIPS